MKILVAYRPDYLKALVRNGMIDGLTGFRVTMNCRVPEEVKFNQIAAKGGELYELVLRQGNPFYVDRLQGGSFYKKYDYDLELLRHYREILGENFLGLQMHELGCVRRLDWKRIQRAVGHPQPWTPEEIIEEVRKISSDKENIHLSCGTAYEYAADRMPQSYHEQIDDFKRHIAKRMEETDGFAFPCEAGRITYHLMAKHGVRTYFSEQGGQTPNLRVQTAIARGMAHAAGGKWCVFYENYLTLNGRLGRCNFLEDAPGDWYGRYFGPRGNPNATYPSIGGEYGGGSSRSVQKRIGFYALTSGADFYTDEFAVSSNFRRMSTAELSPFGRINKEMMTYFSGAGDVKPVVMAAVVLPRELEYFDTMLTSEAMLCDFECPELYETAKRVCDILAPVFGADREGVGNEEHIMRNSAFHDSVDILYEDAPAAVLNRYPLLVDATPGGRFSGSYQGSARVLSGEISEIHRTLQKELDRELGYEIEGNAIVQPFVKNGMACIAVYNGDGILRSVERGDERLPEGKHSVVLRFARPFDLKIEKQSADDVSVEVKEQAAEVTLPAGEFVLLSTGWPEEIWKRFRV